VPSGLTDTPSGLNPTAIVVITAFVAVLITETLLERSFDTYTRLPSGVIVTPNGPAPTNIFFITVFVTGSITETVLSL